MGGLLAACGCYDGPWSPEDPTAVSVRCDAHLGEVPALQDHLLIPKAGAGAGAMRQMMKRQQRLARIRARGHMAVPKGKRR